MVSDPDEGSPGPVSRAIVVCVAPSEATVRAVGDTRVPSQHQRPVGRLLAGNRKHCTGEESGAEAAVGNTLTTADGGCTGTGLLLPHGRERGQSDSRAGRRSRKNPTSRSGPGAGTSRPHEDLEDPHCSARSLAGAAAPLQRLGVTMSTAVGDTAHGIQGLIDDQPCFLDGGQRRLTTPPLTAVRTPYDLGAFTSVDASPWRSRGGSMDPASVGTTARIASSVARPIIARLFVKEGPGAGLVDKPVRVSRLVSWGEKRSLNQLDMWKIARELVKAAIEANPHEPPIASDEREALADALAATLSALGSLEMDDVQAVRLGQEELARRLKGERPDATRDLSADATTLYDSLVDLSCLHILHFFTQRSTFVAHALVAQTRMLDEALRTLDALADRIPAPAALMRSSRLAISHTWIASTAS